MFTNFDYIFIRVNGIEVFMNDPNGLLSAWETGVADLSTFVGQASITMEFVLFTLNPATRQGRDSCRACRRCSGCC